MPLWWRAAIKVFAECAELSALMYRRFDEALALYAAMAAPDDTCRRCRRRPRRSSESEANVTFVTMLRACRGRRSDAERILRERVPRRLLEDVMSTDFGVCALRGDVGAARALYEAIEVGITLRRWLEHFRDSVGQFMDAPNFVDSGLNRRMPMERIVNVNNYPHREDALDTDAVRWITIWDLIFCGVRVPLC